MHLSQNKCFTNYNIITTVISITAFHCIDVISLLLYYLIFEEEWSYFSIFHFLVQVNMAKENSYLVSSKGTHQFQVGYSSGHVSIFLYIVISFCF